MASDVGIKRELLITDVTHMQGEKVCIVGIDHHGTAIRPILPPPGIFQSRLLLPTGVIRPRAVIEAHFKPKKKVHQPHIEDMDWDILQNTRITRVVDDSTWQNALEKTTFDTVESIFETKIKSKKSIQLGAGVRSIGTIKVKSIEYLKYEVLDREEGEKHGYRLSFRDSSDAYYYDISIADLNFRYFFHHFIQDSNHITASAIRLQERLKKTECYLRIGLTREWSGSHWLQVNGIYTFPDYAKGMCFMDYKQAGVALPD